MDEFAPPAGPWQAISDIWAGYRVPILLGAGSLFCIGVSLILLVKSVQTATPIRFTNVEGISERPITNIMIDVAGAVVSPGVYTLPVGSRVNDAIAAAGGLAPQADLELISKSLNKAAVLSDGAKLTIPVEGDEAKGIDTMSHNNGFTTSTDGVTSTEPQMLQSGVSQNEALISVNSGTIAEYDSLPGIGPVTAQKIISNRPYGSVTELLERKVLKASVYEKVKDRLTL